MLYSAVDRSELTCLRRLGTQFYGRCIVSVCAASLYKSSSLVDHVAGEILRDFGAYGRRRRIRITHATGSLQYYSNTSRNSIDDVD